MAADLPDVVERFVADVSAYVRDLERAAREADHFGDQNEEARERVQRFGRQAEEAAERAARAQAEAAREAERLADGTGDMERAARAAARAQRELERAQQAQTRAARAAAQQADNEADQYRELAREAARAAAEQQLLQFRTRGQFREHNQLLRRLRDEYGDFGDEFNRNFRQMESRARQTFDGFRNSGVENINKVQAAIVLRPVAAAAAAGAITFGVGGALAGIGILAASKSEEVQEAFARLKKSVVADVKEWAEPFQGELVEIAAIADRTFDSLGPHLRDAFADLAPVVTRFVDSTAEGFERFGPLIDDFVDGFEAVAGDLGSRMPQILDNLADGLSAIAQAAQENPEAFGELIEDISILAQFVGQLTPLLSSLSGGFHDVMQVVGAVGDAIGPLSGPLSSLASSFLAFSNPLGLVADGARRTKDAFDRAGQSSQDFGNRALVMNGVIDATALATGRANSAQSRSQILMQLASQSADKLKASLDNLSGKTISAREAAANYGTAVLQMNKSLKDNGKAHGFATAKGIQNEQALNTLAQSAQDNAVAMRDNGASAKEVARFMERARKKFIDSAVAAGYSREEAVKLADRLYGVRNAANSIPKKKHTKVTADTKDAQSTVERFIGWVGRQVARINISSIWPFAQGGPVPALAGGGQVGIPGFPTGGPVRGPGTGTSDSIVARLSNGEFVMTAAANRMFGPLLAVMNRVAAGGAAPSVPSPSSTRPVATMARAGGGATVVQYVTHVHVAGSVWSERELWEVVQRQSGQYNTRNPGTNAFVRGGGGF